MPRLVLGPILRAVHRGRVTVWVETDSPCEATVGSHVAHTVTLQGRHYAFIDVGGLAEAEPYTVALNGHQVWLKVLEEVLEAVSDRGRGVRSRGERPAHEGRPNHRR